MIDKCIKLLDEAPHYNEDFMPENLVVAIEWMQSYLEQIPPEFRGSGKIEIKTDDSYGAATAHMTISYVRPETGEEERERLAREVRDTMSVEARERAELARLKAKYEGGVGFRAPGALRGQGLRKPGISTRTK